MFKKLWYQPTTRFVIAFLFFAYTIYITVKIVLMHFPGPDAYQPGWIEQYYLAPVISAVMGYLFFKSGRRIQKNRKKSDQTS